jgi:hypothetical protein
MFKSLAIAVISMGIATSAFAMDCTQPNIDTLDTQIKALTDKPAQDSAMKEAQMAKDMMAKKDMAGCTMHIDAAMKAGNMAMNCTQPNIDKLDTQIKALTDKTAQDSAMKEAQMAKDMMAKKDMAGCTTHIDAAMKAGNITMQ